MLPRRRLQPRKMSSKAGTGRARRFGSQYSIGLGRVGGRSACWREGIIPFHKGLRWVWVRTVGGGGKKGRIWENREKNARHNLENFDTTLIENTLRPAESLARTFL